MASRAPETKEEQKFQYCNYGYDTSKYKSFDDCMANYYKYNKSDLPDSLNKYNTQTNTTKEPIYYITITAVVLVAGYFAYKKFKK
jgi:hypothetical protein